MEGVNGVRFIGIGLIGTILALIYGFFTQRWETTVQIIGWFALVPLLLAGLLAGVFVSGDRNRANYHSGDKETRKARGSWTVRFLLIGAPNAVCVLLFVVIAVVQNGGF